MSEIGSRDAQRLGSGYQRFFGKYRGKVFNNEDPLFLGRIQAMVSILPGVELNWAMPCTPYAGFGVGFYAIPPLEANVWIEFEGGDVNKPIWAGCFWAEGETPIGSPEPPNPFVKTLKTEWITLTLNDTPEVGGVTIECLPPAVLVPLKMTFDSLGVTITAPPATLKMITEEGITLTYPPGMVSMTALEVSTVIAGSSEVLTEEAISLVSTTIAATAEGAIIVEAAGDIEVTAGGALNLKSGAEASLTAGLTIEVEASADVMITGAIVMIN